MYNAHIYRSPAQKLERAIAEETLRWSEHRVRIRFDGEFQAGCSCSWRGPKRAAEAEAERDGAGHGGECHIVR